jgi:hypothetical protein
MADVEGRMEDRPREMKAKLLPFDDVNIETILAELETQGRIDRYKVKGLKVVQIVGFLKHQRIMGREAEGKSEYPPNGKPWKTMGNSGLTRVKPGNPNTPPLGKTMGNQGIPGSPSSPSASSSPSLSPTPPITPSPSSPPSSPTPKPHKADEDFIPKLKAMECYKGIDIDTEVKKMKAWLSTRPARQFTKRFVTNWLMGAIDNMRTIATPPAPIERNRDDLAPQAYEPIDLMAMARAAREREEAGAV